MDAFAIDNQEFEWNVRVYSIATESMSSMELRSIPLMHYPYRQNKIKITVLVIIRWCSWPHELLPPLWQLPWVAAHEGPPQEHWLCGNNVRRMWCTHLCHQHPHLLVRGTRLVVDHKQRVQLTQDFITNWNTYTWKQWLLIQNKPLLTVCPIKGEFTPKLLLELVSGSKV